MPKEGKLREMLLDAVADTMKLTAIPDHAMTSTQLMDKLREREYRFGQDRLRTSINKLVEQGIIKKARSGGKVFYWFVEDETK